MKRLTTFLLTLFLITLGASAQVDYSWALSAGTWYGNTGTYAGGIEHYQDGSSGGACTAGKILYEIVSELPAGEYELTFYAVANTAWNSYATGSGIAQVYVTSNGETQTEDVNVYDQTACTPSDYPHTFTVEVGSDGTLEYGLQNIATGGNWYVCQGVSLIFSGEATTKDLEPGEVVEKELGDENSISHYSLTYTGSGSNGGLDYNTWSGESGMTTPYHQVWVYMGDNKNVTLSDMTINHYEIPLLPAGTYTVTVDARVLSEAGNAINEGSAFFCANEASVDIVAEATTDEDFSYGGATEHEANGTYTLTATVGDDGTLDIHFTITNATYNWISWKNLSVTFVEAAEEEEPEDVDSDNHEGDVITVDGVNYTLLCDNRVENHSFELGFDGWTSGSSKLTAPIDSDSFKLVTKDEDPDQISGNQYLVGIKNNSMALAGSLGKYWEIEAGKTYYLSYWVKNLTGASGDERFLRTTLVYSPSNSTNDSGRLELDTPETISEEWQKVEYVFTNDDHAYVQVSFSYLNSHWGFDNFSLYEVEAAEAEPEDTPNDYQPGDVITVDGVEYTVLDENEISNHSFELGFEGWTKASDFTTTISEDFELRTDDPENGVNYLVGTSTSSSSSTAGAAGTSSLGTAWPIEAGATYVFTYWLKQTDMSQSAELNYIVTSLTNTPGTETAKLAEPTISEEWQPVQYVFTNDEGYAYVQVDFRWLKGRYGFDNFSLHKVEAAEVEPEYVYETVYECVADGLDWQKPDHWTAANDATTNLHINTHSTEADPSGMVTPFVEYWYGAGTNLPDDVLSHDELVNLEAGEYEVTIEVRAFNESGATAITAGTTFNANGVGVDLTEAGLTSSTAYSGHYELYGEVTVLTEVTEAGTMAINFNVKDANYNWLAFKNLKVAKRTSTADIELVAVDGPMNAAVQAAMEDAIATFESTRTADSYYEAVAAIEAAEVSAAYYAPIVAAVDALDEDGAAVWAESNYATALADRTLTDEDVSADLAAAQKAQTAEGSDMTYVVLYDGDWAGNTGIYQTGVERYGDEIEVEDETVKVLYKTIEDLTPGTYEVTFYAVANNAWVGAAYGDGIAQVFANETTEAVTVHDQTACTLESEEYLYTITCTVDNDGVLEFGLQNVATGGNWYVAEAVSLTLVEATEEDPYIYDVTYALANPSFELDDIETLEYDETRNAYVVESPEGWTLTGEPSVSDIMTADATATDNNFGVPGEPSDGAQMLYLRNSWEDNKEVTLLQGLTLPAGDYKLTVDTKCVSTTSSTATLVAGDESVALTIHGTENGSEATKENPFLDAWDTAVLTFTLTAETTLDLGVDIVFNGGNGSFLLDNFQLWSAEEVVITVDGNDNDYAVGDEVEIDGVTYAVVSDNMFVNGGFGDDVNDWTGSDYVTAADPDDFTLNATGGYNDGEYLTIASSSTGGGQGPGTTTTVNNLTQSIQIESGKTYLFVGYTTGGTTTGGGGPNQSTTTSGLNQMSNATTEVTQSSGGQGPGGQTTTAVAYVTLEWGSTTPGQQSAGWTQTLAVFTAETPYAGMHLARSGSYDGFQLYEVEEVVEISDNEYAAGDVAEIDGIEYAVVSDNMVVNGGFDDGVDGWTAGDGTDNYVTAADPDNFTLETEGGFNDGAYITIPSTVGGYSSVSSPTQAIAVEEGKTYLFIGYTKGTVPTERNQAYNALVQMSDAYNEVVTSGHDAIVEVQLLWGAEPEETAEEWTKTEGIFTATTPYVGLRFSWCPNGSFDGIQLYEVESAEVEPEPTPGEPVDWLAHSEEAVFEHWTTTGNNGTLQYNTWSTESDASGMTTPFIENWVNSSGDTPLTAATISHNTLVGLPAGDYTVSLDIRILNELEENVTTGTTFNANGVSVDLVQAGTSGTYDDYYPEVYGTYTVECEVGDDGLLDISIEIPSNATYNWIAFKNLDVTIHADGTPVVTALEGLMAADARAAMEAAIEAYNANPSESLFTAAIDAIQDASQATEEYAEIMALVEALDEAGRAAWDETASGIAYNNGTLSANADYTADMATAQKAQTTEGSDMTYVVLYEGTWIGQTGTYKTDYIERYDNDAAFTASDGKILYKQIDGLQPGTYTVTFLAVANSAWIGSAYGSNIAQVFVNEALEDVLVYNQVECIPTEYPHTMTGTVGRDGILEFGLQNIGTGGNWYVAQAVSMTLGGEATPSVSKGDYEFINEDWVSLDLGRVSQSDISYNIDDNTITVNAGTGKNNVALGNSLSYSADGTITTADYTVGNSQNWFIVVGTDLSTAEGDSYLWWMNGDNKNSSVAPTYYGVMEDGQVLFAWDVTTSGLNDNLQESLNYLDGWTGFGLTSTTGTSVISDISFYTWDDAVAKYPDLTYIATGIKSVGVDVEAEGIYTLSGMRLSKITKSGIYIIDGKKVLVK